MNIPAGTKELTDYGITLTAAQINDAEQQSNKNQPNGYAGLNGDGDFVGPIIPQTVTNEVLEANQIAFRDGAFVKGDGASQGGVWAAMPLRADSFVVVERGATDAASGDNLLAAYTAAKALTPGGNALSATNRATLLIPPGRYDLNGGTLTLDTQFVDVSGLGARESTVIYSAEEDVTNGIVVQTANDVRVSDLTIRTPAYGLPVCYGPTASFSNTIFTNVWLNNLAGYAVIRDVGFSGIFRRVLADSWMFAAQNSQITVSGLFEDCVAGQYSYGAYQSGDETTLNIVSATFRRCRLDIAGNPFSVSWDCKFSGLMEECRWFLGVGVMYIGEGARIYNSTVFNTGTGTSIYAASAVTVEISNCHTPQGIGANVTNSNASENTSFSLQVSGTLATGDGQAYVTIPAKLGGKRLRRVHARVLTAGTTGTTDIQIANVTNSTDLLSTKLTIDSGETGSDTAATPAVIDADNNLLTTNDLLRIDIDAVSSTAPVGLIVTLEAY